jgi:hypothetical protein
MPALHTIMRNFIIILVIALNLFSCRSNNIEGIWISEVGNYEGYVLAMFTNNQASFKYLNSGYYDQTENIISLEKTENNTYKNESFTIKCSLKDSLKIVTYQNDSIIEVENFLKFKKYGQFERIDSFKESIYKKSLKYEDDQVIINEDIVDNIRSYNYNITKTPIGFDYYGCFNLGTELFLVLNNGFPIQIISNERDQIIGSNPLIRANHEMKIVKQNLPSINEKVIGEWLEEDENELQFLEADEVVISRDSFIYNSSAQKSNSFSLFKLSHNDKYVLTSNETKPFLIEIKNLNQSELLITNYRNRKVNTMNLIKK